MVTYRLSCYRLIPIGYENVCKIFLQLPVLDIWRNMSDTRFLKFTVECYLRHYHSTKWGFVFYAREIVDVRGKTVIYFRYTIYKVYMNWIWILWNTFLILTLRKLNNTGFKHIFTLMTFSERICYQYTNIKTNFNFKSTYFNSKFK